MVERPELDGLVWDVRGSFEEGVSVEMAIPFKSLKAPCRATRGSVPF
jgi:hypothetical protein